MRSLQLVDSVSWISKSSPGSAAQQISIDYDTGNVYLATATGITAHNPSTGEVIHNVSLSEAGFTPPDGTGAITGLQYLPDQISACLTTSTGDVILWNVESNELECVGTVDSGLTAMAWSPDQELVVFTTGQNTVIVMSREFDPITEAPLISDEFGEAEFVNVGWGKKETQFHGSEGKQAATRKVADVKPASEWDDRQTRISWRGDGQFFVVSSINPHTGARHLRVWTREVVLHSSSEKVDGLEQCLSWKPQGSLIVSSQRKPNKHEIVFFELNGLTHGGFTLPFGVKEVKVKEVFWNTDSCVLAVWLEELSKSDTNFCPKSYVQLWTVNNYHWYLKQSLEFKATEEDRVSTVTWDPEHAYRIHITVAGGRYMQYTFTWQTLHSQGRTEHDLANVIVVDGDKALVTPFRSMIVPPPMCAYYLQLPTPVCQVTHDPTPGSNAIGLLLNDNRVVLYRFDQNSEQDATVKLDAAGGGNFGVRCKLPSKSFTMNLSQIVSAGYPLAMNHLTWIRKSTFLFCCHNENTSSVIMTVIDLGEKEPKIISQHPIPESVVATAVNSETGSVVLQLADRTLLSYDSSSDSCLPFCNAYGEEVVLPMLCTQMALCQLGGQEVVLGLTDRFRFYVNNIEVANNCTSFAVHDEFLLLTTHSHTCRCISRKMDIKHGKAHPFDESVRRVERGSRAVHVAAADTRLILQMPRGNLEVINPRALVLTAIRKQLDELQFGKAFNLMRKHRINMNLIHDHNRSAFIENVDTFIRQLDNTNHINLFLTDLQQEDVTVTMYTAAYNRKALDENFGNKPSKVDTVCEAVRQGLLARDADRYLLSILTTYVKTTTPQLDKALNLIKDLKARGGASQKSQVEEALKYLLLLVDVNELYDHALGTYDFELVLMVAERSQKDPKEYIPFLNNLRHLEENYRYYSIDLHLKRHLKALKHISKCGDDHFAECLKLVKDQRLYAEALRLFPKESQHYKDLSAAYGGHLVERGQHGEAGLVYARAALWQDALTAHQEALQWQLALVAATRLDYADDRLRVLAADLARCLVAARRTTDAAYLLEQYAQDVEEAIVTLIQGAAWEEALRLMYKHGRTDFMDSDFLPALDEHHENQTTLLTSMRSDFERHKSRLVVVREEKEKARLELLEGGGDYNQEDADLFSDTSSATGRSQTSSQYTTSSQRSGSSRRSGKSQRKAQRKKWSLKEGGKHENLALIEALSQLCRQAEDIKAEVQSLLRMLALFDKEHKAMSLQKQLDEYLTLIEKSLTVIWDPEIDNSSTPELGPDATTNQIIAAMRQGQGRAKADVELDASLKVPPPMSKDRKWQLHSLTSEKS